MNRVYYPRFGYMTMCSEVSGLKAEQRILKHVGHFLENLYVKAYNCSKHYESYNDYVESHIKFCDKLINLIRSGYTIIIPTGVYWGVCFE